MSTLILMTGLPGSGKTTRAKQLEPERRALRLTPDEWMIPLFGAPDSGDRRSVLEGRFIAIARRTLALGGNVILDFGLWGRDERTALRWLAGEEGATIELVYLPIDLATQRARTNARVIDAPHTTFEYTDADLDRQQAVYEVPAADEFEDVHGSHPASGRDWRSWIERRWPTALD